MRIKFFITGALAFTLATAAFAQKGELSNAQEQYSKFTVIANDKSPLMITQANTTLNSAKVSIDKAAVHPKTAALPETFAIKGAIYAALAYRSQDDASVSTPLFATGEDALKKAKELDTKGESKKFIDDGTLYLIRYKQDAGIKAYQAQKYSVAYDDFLFYRNARPDDTTAIYLTGLSAAASQNYEEAIANYSKLIKTKYSKNPDVYSDLSLIYLQKKDTVAALKTVAEGSEKFPSNTKLSEREIKLNLQTGHHAAVITKLEKAIANDPKNKTLYYYAGLAYSATKDYPKAEAAYRKAVEIDPGYFDASLNLGALLLQPAISLYNAAQKLDVKKQKEYDADMAQVATLLAAAKDVVLHTVDLDPKSYDALVNLKNYYIGMKDLPNATATKKRIDALK